MQMNEEEFKKAAVSDPLEEGHDKDAEIPDMKVPQEVFKKAYLRLRFDS